MAAAWTDLAQYASGCSLSLMPHAQATNSVMQRAGINRSFTGMGSRAGSTGKLPMSRTASGSVLDRQEVDAGDHLWKGGATAYPSLQCSISKGSVSIQLFRGLTRVILRCNDCHAIMQRSEQLRGFDIYRDRKMACVQEVRRAS